VVRNIVLRCLGTSLLLSGIGEAAGPDAGRSPALELIECPRWSTRKIEDLIDLELGLSSDHLYDTSRLKLELHCAPDRITLRILGAGGQERISRDMTPPDTALREPERELALVASQLILALGTYTGSKQYQPTPVTAPESGAGDDEGSSRAAPPSPGRLTLFGAYQLSARSLSEKAFLFNEGILGVGYEFASPFTVRAFASYGTGESSRRTGELSAHSFSMGASLGTFYEWSPHWQWKFALQGRAQRTVIEAKAYDELENRGRTLRGWTPDFSIRTGPRMKLGTSALGFYPTLGLSPVEARATVPGDSALEWGGVWLGVALEVEFFLTR